MFVFTKTFKDILDPMQDHQMQVVRGEAYWETLLMEIINYVYRFG